ncbi:hypothetical protein [Marichromatium bheemlicum]|uniref:Lipoprotein n=1 Tax=Marichromatium bheemlicum TaxID=365339 RepID=A0ABX1I8K1_9GAMM|nr:hypothetical protein [Marichromatium bheemlicum]NKN33883.1 hypothetical protein [Marichromatium bheemlicum]
MLLSSLLLGGCGESSGPADAAQLRELHARMVQVRADVAAARLAEAHAGAAALQRLCPGLTPAQRLAVERLVVLVETEWRCVRRGRCG